MKRWLVFLALLVPALVLARVAASQDIYRYTANTQRIPYGGSSVVVTNAFNGQTRVVRLVCTSACYIAVGASSGSSVTNTLYATAATGAYLPTNVPELFMVSGGQHVAVVQVSSGGALTVTEMTK